MKTAMIASERLLEIEGKLGNYPHHKHIGRQKDIQPSEEASLEDVMEVIRKKI